MSRPPRGLRDLLRQPGSVRRSSFDRSSSADVVGTTVHFFAILRVFSAAPWGSTHRREFIALLAARRPAKPSRRPSTRLWRSHRHSTSSPARGLN